MTGLFETKIIKSGSVPVFLVSFKTHDHSYRWFYITSSHEKVKIFNEIKTGTFDIRDYGKIIAWGHGKAPSDTVKLQIKSKYGCC